MIASPQQQLALLQLQALDTRLQQLVHAKRGHLTVAQLDQFAASQRELTLRLSEARTAVTDVGRELTKAEDAVQHAQARADRNQARLDSGALSHKDAVALTEEMVALRRHIGNLEETQLEVMERLEAHQRIAEDAAAAVEASSAQRSATQAEQERAFAEIDAEGRAALLERDGLAKRIDPALVATYEQIRKRLGGVGAARLAGGRCEGCGLHLTSRDLEAAMSAPDDAVVRCEECGRILVRATE